MPGVLPGGAESAVAAGCPLYEQELLQEASGDTLRPGGMELTARLLARCELPPGARLLDIGCGRGASLVWLQTRLGCNAIGVDISTNLLNQAASMQLTLANARAARLPFPTQAFDATLFECSLSVIAMQEAHQGGLVALTNLGALQEAGRVLRAGGWLLLSDLYARRPEGIPALRALPGASCLCGLLDMGALEKVLQTLGFEICFWEDHSETLRQLSSRLCQTYGSMPTFWDQALGKPVDAFDLAFRIGLARPGYFILLARKRAGQAAAALDETHKIDNEVKYG